MSRAAGSAHAKAEPGWLTISSELASGRPRAGLWWLASLGPSWRYLADLSPARRGADMKVNIEIDCTPLEARQFMGLPDVTPMQTAVMDKLQQQMMSNIEKISPDSLIQSWFSFDPKLAERMQEMFVSMTGLGALSGDKKK
jgi:hypothetical protein